MIKVSVFKRANSPYWYLRWFEPLSGREFKVSSKTTDRRAADRLAAKKETELESSGSVSDISWHRFRAMFEEQHLIHKSKSTIENFTFALNRFEKDIGAPKRVRDINAQVLGRWSGVMSSQISSTSVASNLRVVRAALGWAHKMGIIGSIPPVSMPKSTSNRGRGISDQELCLLISSAPGELSDLIKGLWLSGLRLDEALKLSFDQNAPVQIDVQRERPILIFRQQKNQRYQEVPTTPDFARFVRSLGRQSGPVFPVTFSKSTIGKRISEAGRLAGIRVSESKFASAHDLRRSFGERWALKLHPITLKTIMRHSTIETTLRHYVRLDSDHLAESIWNSIKSDPAFETEPSAENNLGHGI